MDPISKHVVLCMNPTKATYKQLFLFHNTAALWMQHNSNWNNFFPRSGPLLYKYVQEMKCSGDSEILHEIVLDTSLKYRKSMSSFV